MLRSRAGVQARQLLLNPAGGLCNCSAASEGLVHAPDQGIDLVLAVASLAALHIVQALLVNAATGTARVHTTTGIVRHSSTERGEMRSV